MQILRQLPIRAWCAASLPTKHGTVRLRSAAPVRPDRLTGTGTFADCARGGMGRHAVLRGLCFKACQFNSGRAHQFRLDS